MVFLISTEILCKGSYGVLVLSAKGISRGLKYISLAKSSRDEIIHDIINMHMIIIIVLAIQKKTKTPFIAKKKTFSCILFESPNPKTSEELIGI